MTELPEKDDPQPLQGQLSFPATGWIKRHGADGIIHDDEVEELCGGSQRVWGLMSDRKWHSASSICAAAGADGVPASEGLRRLRDLRPMLSPHGLCVSKRRINGSRLFEYRVEEQQSDG